MLVINWLLNFFRRAPKPSDNYSPRAQKLLVLARKQADRLHLRYVGTEHLLLGLLELKEGVGFAALQRLGVNPDNLRQDVDSHCSPGGETAIAPLIPMTPRAAHVLKLACREARRMGHAHVGTEHIFLGLIQQRQGIAAVALRKHQIELESARLGVIAASQLPTAKA